MPPSPSRKQSIDTAEGSFEDQSRPDPSDLDANGLPPSARARKRTKTGCLTCRKRRIKCGEERPVCANCVKSKRTCEGYAPRLTFRDPVALGPGWLQRGIAAVDANGIPLPPQIHTAGGRPYLVQKGSPTALPHFPILAPRLPSPDPARDRPHPSWPGTVIHNAQELYVGQDYTRLPESASAPLPGYIDSYHDQMLALSQKSFQAHTPSRAWPVDAAHAFEYSSLMGIPSNAGGALPAGVHADLVNLQRSEDGQSPAPRRGDIGPSSGWSPSLVNADAHIPPLEPLDQVAANVSIAPQMDQLPSENSPDAVDSDDEVPMPSGTVSYRTRHEYGLMLALAASGSKQAIHTYDAFVEAPDMLAAYDSHYSASPLMDATTARIFCHFITATAPSLSIFERHPVDTSLIFSGKMVPRVSQATWTYVLPAMALANQTLLQAMLALSSLNIACMNGSSRASSIRHYAFALKRVAKAVSSPFRRTAIPTLAATLLLGHYEATSAEHAQWSSHLAGARQLLLEVDFDNTIRKLFAARMQGLLGVHWRQPLGYAQFQSTMRDLPWIPDHGSSDKQVLEQLSGHIFPSLSSETSISETASPLTEKDIEDFQVSRDLFWFYCKQDIIQSCLSGNPLLLPYARWNHCIPRGPLWKPEAVWGTMDHMLLLMGRVRDFAHSDGRRKERVKTREMGASEPLASYTEIPTSFPSDLPASFENAPRGTIYHPPTGHVERSGSLSAEAAVAENEWTTIDTALQYFETCTGASFRPLPPDAAPLIATPFGDAIQYTTYQISTIWLYYYTARIIHLRAHPSMPSSIAETTNLVATQTSNFSILIARIALGLPPPSLDQAFSPSLGAALAESLLGLFVASTTLISNAQRIAIIDRLRLIAKRTGVESAATVAAYLEKEWIRMHDKGHGPPYSPSAMRFDQEPQDTIAIPAQDVTGGFFY